MNQQRHIIKKQVIELNLSSKQDAFALQNEVSRIYRQKVVPLIDTLLSQSIAPDTIYRINTLEINLGNIDINNLEQDLIEKILEQIQQELEEKFSSSVQKINVFESGQKNVGRDNYSDDQQEAKLGNLQGFKIENKRKSQLEIFNYFLETGMLPWWTENFSKQELEKCGDRLITDSPIQAKYIIESSLKNIKKLHRLIYQFSDVILLKIVSLFVGDLVQFVANYNTDIKSIFAQLEETRNIPTAKLRFQRWEGILLSLSPKDNTKVNKLSLVEASLLFIAVSNGINYSQLFNSLVTKIENLVGEGREFKSGLPEILENLRISQSITENIRGDSPEKELLESGEKLTENRRNIESLLQEIEIKNSSGINENLRISQSVTENISGDSSEKELLESGQKLSENQRILERYQQQIQQINRQIESLLEEIKNSTVVENQSNKKLLQSGKKLSENRRKLEGYEQQIQEFNRQIESLLAEIKDSPVVKNQSNSEVNENLIISESVTENISGDYSEKELLESGEKSSENQQILERYQQQIQEINRQIESLLAEIKDSAVVKNQSNSEINENLINSQSVTENIPRDSSEKELLESGQKLSENRRRLERYQQQIQQLNQQIESLLAEIKDSAVVENQSNSEINENLINSQSVTENISGDSEEKELLESGEKFSQNRRILEGYQEQIQEINRQIESLLQEIKDSAVVKNQSNSEINENLRISESVTENIRGDSEEKELLESGEKFSQNRQRLERYQQEIQEINRQIESLLGEIKDSAVVKNQSNSEINENLQNSQSFTENISGNSEEKELLESEKKSSQNRQILERYKKQIQQLNQQIENLLQQIKDFKELSKSGEKLSKNQRKLERYQQQIKQLNRQTKFLDIVNNFSNSDEIYIGNAGLILLWPFIKRFFVKIELVQENIFINITSAGRAAILLQYIVDNSIEIPEHILPLNKILCGIDLLEPIDTNLEITKQEITECQNLLSAVIQNWSILKNTSIEGFRKAFLQRNGILKIRDGSYLLQVERETYDILINKIPWSIQAIKLPWMDNILYVEW